MGLHSWRFTVWVFLYQVFGEQVSFGSPYGSPEVLDFPTYCACRFLDTAPDNPVPPDTLKSLCRLLLAVEQEFTC